MLVWPTTSEPLRQGEDLWVLFIWIKAASYKNGLIFHIWPELYFQTEYLIFTLKKKSS